MAYDDDIETGFMNQGSYNWEKEVRHGFIRKVFGILAVQLIITTAIGAVFVVVEPVNLYVTQNMWPLITAVVLTFLLFCVLSCSKAAQRTHPWNLILLFIFTLAESCFVGTISAFAKAEYVLAAFGITAIITIALTIYASQTKYDFTMCGGVLLGFLIALIVASLLGIFLFPGRIFSAVIGGVGALLFSAYLVFDVQLIMGGKKYELSPDEYVFGALALYLDVINIFLYVLQIFSAAGR
eukprot:TRINITY_DN9582_c0_g1_i3.p3 TRINITY_DN9582_c0_g1~~TRINITY_DN9582_c0_g1_i3.p3  ORF type:complete len:239 (-),score=39.05 TRINITY_DN9582_c0_g1_i3:150-866(-)